MSISAFQHKTFNGDKKHLVHFLAPYERKFLKAAVPWVPANMSTRQLTMMTVIWSLAVVLAGYWARQNIHWLWLFNAAVIMQYITDMLDGEVGRLRNTGLVKWGFYMDHFLDYIFLASIVIGYSLLLPSYDVYLGLLALTAVAGYMVHTFLDFTITNNFKISCNLIGVSEMRCLIIAFNIILMVSGKGLLAVILPWVVPAAFIGLFSIVWSSQKIYRHIDTLQQAQKDGV